MRLLLVTHNRHKLEEIRQIMPPETDLLCLDDIGFTEEIAETENTLEGNALLKARVVYNKSGISCFADDTGLEVEALDNEPGVYSARYAGPEQDYQKNTDKLLHTLKNVSHRKARFRTVICLILDDREYLFEGIVNGNILTEKRGNKGFGYDPVFVPEGFDRTFAEMNAEEKNRISHRALALEKMIGFLKK